MRPRKIVLCVNDNEQELSIWCYMLEVKGYRAVRATSGELAIEAFKSQPVDLVMTDYGMPQMNGTQLVNKLKQIASHIPMVILGDPKTMAGQVHMADALLDKRMCSVFELLEHIKVMSARKRGPRKGTKRIPLANSAKVQNNISSGGQPNASTEVETKVQVPLAVCLSPGPAGTRHL